MPTTFNVVSLGNFADLDTTEGDNVAENAAALVGQTFGGPGDALVDDFVSLSPGSTGFSGGTATAYDQDTTNDTFSIDGGADQVFDSASVYNATVTYIDGTTATITAVVFQDDGGNTYWAPEFSANADQGALDAAAIRSISFDSLLGNSFSGLTGTRETWDFVTCFTTGVRLQTPRGYRAIETLSVGDELITKDNGIQKIRWISRASRAALGPYTPVRICAHSLGNGLPKLDIVVSQQHRMLMRSKIAKRISGTHEVLVAAKKLVGQSGISFADDAIFVTYYHVLLDQHDIIYAEGAPTETLLTGPMAFNSFNSDALAEIQSLFPDCLDKTGVPARKIMSGKPLKQLLSRHEKHQRDLIMQ